MEEEAVDMRDNGEEDGSLISGSLGVVLPLDGREEAREDSKEDDADTDDVPAAPMPFDVVPRPTVTRYLAGGRRCSGVGSDLDGMVV